MASTPIERNIRDDIYDKPVNVEQQLEAPHPSDKVFMPSTPIETNRCDDMSDKPVNVEQQLGVPHPSDKVLLASTLTETNICDDIYNKPINVEQQLEAPHPSDKVLMASTPIATNICDDIYNKPINAEQQLEAPYSSDEDRTESDESIYEESKRTNLPKVEEQPETPLSANTIGSMTKDGVKLCEESPSTSKQLVLYDPNFASNIQDSNKSGPPSVQSFSVSQSSWEPSGKYAVQCEICLKWRLIASKEKYEEIREAFSQREFVCAQAREWRPNLSCEDPTDVSQEGKMLWAIDKPDIARTPPGWERVIRFRREGGSKFCDVYYITPTGMSLRSAREVKMFLEDPACAYPASLSQFSFKAPKPLRSDYVKKRPRPTQPKGDRTLKSAKTYYSEGPSNAKNDQTDAGPSIAKNDQTDAGPSIAKNDQTDAGPSGNKKKQLVYMVEPLSVFDPHASKKELNKDS